MTGGNSNVPVRYGDRVHRIAGTWTPTVHAYLRHLRAAGLQQVPEPFGFDAEGREVLAFLPGTVPAYPLPDLVWSDRFLTNAVRLLRALHDASVDFERSGAIWQQPARVPDEVISINDFAPYNLVLRGDRIVGVIDLDQASPGPRARDLAHVAYRLVPLTAPQNQDGRDFRAPERRRRLQLIAEAYGGIDVGTFLAEVPQLLADLAAHAAAAGRPDHASLYTSDSAWIAGYLFPDRH